MRNEATEQSPGSQVLCNLLERVPLPCWAPVRLFHDDEHLSDVNAAVAEQLARPECADAIRPGMKIALTAGSRGIDRIGEVLAATVDQLKRRGGAPFIVPAMGSHGGAVAEGQIHLLAHYGITEASMGCPIRASMEVVEVGQLPSGERLYTDQLAYAEADLIIPIGRVKPHTDFTGTIESGLLKMLAIGLGKQHGADSLHASGFEQFPWLIPTAGRFLLKQLPVPFGIALVENGYGELALLEAIPAAQIETREGELLENARQRMARLPIEHLDVLVVDQMGKDVSGAGMDPNVLGHYYDQKLPHGPDVQRVVVLDLTSNSEGNATGVGMADFCTERLVKKIDRATTYMNQLTSKTPAGGRLPMTAPSDKLAIQMALSSLRRARHDAIRLMRISSTKDLTNVWASEAVLPDLVATGRAELRGKPLPPTFNDDGNLW